jgi:hypothetical protein
MTHADPLCIISINKSRQEFCSTFDTTGSEPTYNHISEIVADDTHQESLDSGTRFSANEAANQLLGPMGARYQINIPGVETPTPPTPREFPQPEMPGANVPPSPDLEIPSPSMPGNPL